MTTDTHAPRIRRLADQMPDGATALFCDPANVRWATGFAGEPHRLYGNAPLWAVIGPDGEWRVVAPASELAWLAEQGDDSRIVPHGRFVFLGRSSDAMRRCATAPRSLHTALREALAQVGAGSAVVADDGARPSVLSGVALSLGARRLRIDPAPALRARAVKDPGEIELLRRANRAAECGILRALARARAGTTEAELLRWVREAMVAHGAEPRLGSIGIGERGALVDFVPGDRPLRQGDVIRFDVGCVLDGYHADLARTAVFGAPSGGIADMHAALVAGQDAALAALKPGAETADLFQRAIEATRSAGIPEYDRSHCGHGIGLDIYETPLLAPRDPTTLARGMTLCVETPLYLIGVAGLQIEDAVVVTDDGYEFLGELPRTLLSVDEAAA